MNNYKFVFTTGAPGSAWSMISQRLKKNLKGFDFSDEVEERSYDIPANHSTSFNIIRKDWKGKTHSGAYFGPYHEFGHNFNDLNFYNSADDFYTECLKPFSNENKPLKLIKSHWFAYNLDWIWNNCKGHSLFLIWRDPSAAEAWWYNMGGWDINYPIYTWYENSKKMHQQIIIENKLIEEFANKKNIQWYDYNTNDEWLVKKFKLKKIKCSQANPVFQDTIKVAYVNII